MRGRIGAVAALAGVTMLGVMATAPDANAQLDSEALEYMTSVMLLVDMVGDTMTDLVAANEILIADMTDRGAMAEVFAETGVFEAVYESARELEPPAMMEDSHDQLLQGLELYADAAPIMRRALLVFDSDGIAEATVMVQEGNAHLGMATEMLPDVP